MPQPADCRDMLHLTERYYTRLRDLLALVPDGALNARVGAAGLTVAETLHHVAQADLWYVGLIDGSPADELDPASDADSLRALLDASESKISAFIEAQTQESLARTCPVPAWWAEGEDRSVRLILMQSLAHKYYHCGQLQSILYAIAANAG